MAIRATVADQRRDPDDRGGLGDSELWAGGWRFGRRSPLRSSRRSCPRPRPQAPTARTASSPTGAATPRCCPARRACRKRRADLRRLALRRLRRRPRQRLQPARRSAPPSPPRAATTATRPTRRATATTPPTCASCGSSASGAGLHIAAFLQTMKVPDAAAVTLAIDTGRARDGDRVARRRGHRLRRAPTRSSPSGAPAAGSPTGAGGACGSAARPSTSARTRSRWTCRGRSIPYVRGRTVTLYAVSGLADAAAGYLQAGPAGQASATAARRRAARRDAPRSTRPSTRRRSGPARSAATGARSASRGCSQQRDVFGLGQRVRPRRPRGRQSREPYAPAPGRFYNRIFRSTQNFGEGIVLKQPTGPNAGRQPRPAVPLAVPAVRALPARRLQPGNAGAAAAQRPLARRQPQRVPGGVAEPLQPARRRALEHRDHAARPRDGHLVHRRRLQGRARGMGRPARATTRSTTTARRSAATRWAAT